MPLIGQGPWTDAARYGEGAGNAISQALLGLPQARAQQAMELAQFQQRQNQLGLMNQLAQQKQQALDQYRQGTLDWRQNTLQGNNDYRNLLGQVALLRAQQAQSNGQNNQLRNLIDAMHYGVVAPTAQTGGIGTGQSTQNTLQQNPPNPQNSLPQGFQFTTPGQKQMTPNELMRNQLDAGRLYAGALSSTNLPSVDPKFVGSLSNMYYGQQPSTPANSLPTRQQGSEINTNAILQQAQQAIQQGANPNLVRQRLQTMGLNLQ